MLSPSEPVQQESQGWMPLCLHHHYPVYSFLSSCVCIIQKWSICRLDRYHQREEGQRLDDVSSSSASEEEELSTAPESNLLDSEEDEGEELSRFHDFSNGDDPDFASEPTRGMLLSSKFIPFCNLSFLFSNTLRIPGAVSSAPQIGRKKKEGKSKQLRAATPMRQSRLGLQASTFVGIGQSTTLMRNITSLWRAFPGKMILQEVCLRE